MPFFRLIGDWAESWQHYSSEAYLSGSCYTAHFFLSRICSSQSQLSLVKGLGRARTGHQCIRWSISLVFSKACDPLMSKQLVALQGTNKTQLILMHLQASCIYNVVLICIHIHVLISSVNLVCLKFFNLNISFGCSLWWLPQWIICLHVSLYSAFPQNNLFTTSRNLLFINSFLAAPSPASCNQSIQYWFYNKCFFITKLPISEQNFYDLSKKSYRLFCSSKLKGCDCVNNIIIYNKLSWL